MEVLSVEVEGRAPVSAGDLGDEIALLAAQLDAGAHRLLTCIRQFDASEEWHHQGAQSCAHWLSWRIGLDPATAREKVRVARALGVRPPDSILIGRAAGAGSGETGEHAYKPTGFR